MVGWVFFSRRITTVTNTAAVIVADTNFGWVVWSGWVGIQSAATSCGCDSGRRVVFQCQVAAAIKCAPTESRLAVAPIWIGRAWLTWKMFVFLPWWKQKTFSSSTAALQHFQHLMCSMCSYGGTLQQFGWSPTQLGRMPLTHQVVVEEGGGQILLGFTFKTTMNGN